MIFHQFTTERAEKQMGPPAFKKHVIARRATPDVAIPWIFKHFQFLIGGFFSYLRDSHEVVRTGSE